MNGRTPPPSAARAVLDKSVVNKFPMFTNSYPNRGAGAHVPGFGRDAPLRVREAPVCFVRVMSHYANRFGVLIGF